MIIQGYVCGLINGLKLLRSEIIGEEPVFERNEVQLRKPEKKETDLLYIGKDYKGNPIFVAYGDWLKMIGYNG